MSVFGGRRLVHDWPLLSFSAVVFLFESPQFFSEIIYLLCHELSPPASRPFFHASLVGSI